MDDLFYHFFERFSSYCKISSATVTHDPDVRAGARNGEDIRSARMLLFKTKLVLDVKTNDAGHNVSSLLSEYYKIGISSKSAFADYLYLIGILDGRIQLKGDSVIRRISCADRVEFRAVKGENFVLAPE